MQKLLIRDKKNRHTNNSFAIKRSRIRVYSTSRNFQEIFSTKVVRTRDSKNNNFANSNSSNEIN